MNDMNDLYPVASSKLAYEYTALKAILNELGITVDVYVGDKPGDVIIDIHGAPIEIKDKITKRINDPSIKPLWDIVIVKME
jgi:hypothetical protein